MSEWKNLKLEEVCDLLDCLHKTPVYSESGYPMVRVTDVKNCALETGGCLRVSEGVYKDFLKGYKPQVGDIVFSRVGSFGNSSIVKHEMEFCIGQNTTLIIPEKINSFFAFYYLISSDAKNQIYGLASGSTQPTISMKSIREIVFPFPPLSEQTAIAEVLSSLDDKIDLLHRQNKTLEQLAETLFRQWFVENKEKCSNQSFSQLIETTVGGEWGKEIPEGDFTKQVCCIRGTDIADLQTGLAERTPIRFVKEKKFETVEPRNGDLILEISGGTEDQSTGRTIYIDSLNRTLFPYPLIFSNFCRLIRPKRNEFSYFLYLYIQQLYSQDEFFNIENGSSGIKNLDYKYLLFELQFPMPQKEEDVVSINQSVKIYFEKINKNKLQIKTLTQLRDTLLPKLMSGEVRVKQNNMSVEI